MASAMKVIMDEFYEYRTLHADNDDFGKSIAYDTFISYANNCHGKTTVETFDYVRDAICDYSGLMDTEDDKEASAEALEVLEALENYLKSNRKK